VSLQIRTRLPETVSGSLIAREVARLLNDTAEEMLSGVPVEKYPSALARYAILSQLAGFIEDAAQKADPDAMETPPDK